jgi:hypothetical protein
VLGCGAWPTSVPGRPCIARAARGSPPCTGLPRPTTRRLSRCTTSGLRHATAPGGVWWSARYSRFRIAASRSMASRGCAAALAGGSSGCRCRARDGVSAPSASDAPPERPRGPRSARLRRSCCVPPGPLPREARGSVGRVAEHRGVGGGAAPPVGVEHTLLGVLQAAGAARIPHFMRAVYRDILKNLSVNVLRPAARC